VGRQGAAAAVLLAALCVEDVVADPPKPAGDLVANSEPSVPEPAAAADKPLPQPTPKASRAAKPAGDLVATAEPSAAEPAAAVEQASAPQPTDKVSPAATADRAAFDTYLDRLMRAESGGRDTAANPRSTALGPFQFIKSTFLDVARRNYSAEVQDLSEDGILRLRTDRQFARRCAETYSRENLAFLAEQGLAPTFGHLRLAFLVGPFAAARLLQAAPATPVADVLGPAVIRANPFMARMSASNLIARSAREVGETAPEVDVAPAPPVRTAAAQPQPLAEPLASPSPRRATRTARRGCNPKLASCRKFAGIKVKAAKVRHAARVAPSRAAPAAHRRNTAETRRRGAGA
jgi:hypothetical protein